jgi:hypothetical protein
MFFYMLAVLLKKVDGFREILKSHKLAGPARSQRRIYPPSAFRRRKSRRVFGP